MTSTSSISAVIPCYNDADYLRRSIGSLQAQSSPPAAVIVVDDGSTDDTPQVCHTLKRSMDVPLIYHRQDNAGVSMARNTGVGLVASEYMVFLDADDELKPDALARYRMAITANPGADWLIAASAWQRDGVVRERSPRLPPSRQQRFERFLNKDLHLGNISNMCFARRVFDRVAFPEDMRFGEDTVVFAILLSTCDPVLIPEIAALAHRRSDSLRTRANLQQIIDSPLFNRVFEHPELPAGYQKFRSHLWARHARSIARRAYREGLLEESVHWYREMFVHQRAYLLDLSMVARYLLARWKVSRQA